ncbi:unnamed protein product [Rhizoctonia solani]|uniref:Lysine-specific metallo-endopeptidase domain-containing protein n=1 Tax=Rhizoctonia solani TaxID=456999 RepID=A0A8H2WN08_9AGAM|nr:unnamed protein product [Rhizoctonia solani]
MNAAIVTLLVSFVISQVSAAPGLVLGVSAPSSTVDIDGLTVKATLKNTGDITLKLLNDPRSILSKVNTNTFSISSASGIPRFTGLKVRYVPSRAAQSTETSAFTTLARGQTIEIDHNLAGTYNFTGCGEGSYNVQVQPILPFYTDSTFLQFSASNIFNYINESGELKTIEASSSSHQFRIAGKLATSSLHASTNAISKRTVSFTGCSADQQSQIKAAATSSASDAMVANANSYLSSLTSGRPRYATCMDYPNTYATHLRESFDRTIDSKAGTIVHENSHFTVNGAAEDHVYGQGDAQALAISNPSWTVMNADSHEYFAENKPVLS